MSALRDIPFQELLNTTAEHCGLDSQRLGASEGRALALYLNAASAEMLRENDWPGAIVTERRTFEGTDWNPVSAVAPGALIKFTRGNVTSYHRRLTARAAGLVLTTKGAGRTLGAPAAWGTGKVIFTNTSDVINKPVVGDWIAFGISIAAYRLLSLVIVGTTTGFVFDSSLPAGTGGLTAGFGIGIVTAPGKVAEEWGVYTAPLRTAYEQAGATPMLDVLAVYSEDPALTDSPAECSYTLDETGILFDSGNPGDVWVRFRKPSPRFGIAPYSAATAYVIGDLAVSWPHCYRCIQDGTAQTPASSPTYWQAQTLPEKVSESVCLDSAIRWLRAQGRYAQAAALKTEREDALDRASRVRNRQEGQTRTYGVANRVNAGAHNYRPRRSTLNAQL